MMKSLLIGTRNPGKVIEITSILADSGWSFSLLQEFPDVGEPEENCETFTENAIVKAQFYASATGLCALADDSGLQVAALGGAPGVRSARYAGKNASDADRRARLHSELTKTGANDQRARFMAVVVIARPDGEILHVSHGICEGTIIFPPRGTGGFGYDPLFVPDGYDQTFAELPDTVKNRISHRARALIKTQVFLRSCSSC
jgi:XTP/dITP diphosphohydrolase